MTTIPTYALYGEYKDDPSVDWIHCETIQFRSRLHNYVIEPHRHEHLFQILYLANGQADFIHDEQHRVLHAPCIVTLPAMVVHGYRFTPDVEGVVLTLFENRLPSVLDAAKNLLEAFDSVRVVSLAQKPEAASALENHVAAIADELGSQAPGRLAAVEAHLALALVALYRLQGHGREALSGPRDRALQHLGRFRQMVDQDFRTHKPVADYARRLGLTATHLNRICRDQLGETALGIIQQRLALEARRYLTFTSLSAKEIALALAFEDPSYFNRFFKRQTGQTPMAFRAMRKG
ncbi:helix-turn-helix domain-containing protein [Microvirga puerhi]|uniref:Helix-turn-helix domain-containing protein n=1 Tax=Microvirga puerhi TaxID=2876078 RepID=A0ABS7VSC2_9HYPH|nr:helix-turn-helix domain-containing protein [Microvirga puerhi]MBZ6077902.1 helix-turn-helix domain-containing protein [Microvirga puerhi]